MPHTQGKGLMLTYFVNGEHVPTSSPPAATAASVGASDERVSTSTLQRSAGADAPSSRSLARTRRRKLGLPRRPTAEHADSESEQLAATSSTHSLIGSPSWAMISDQLSVLTSITFVRFAVLRSSCPCHLSRLDRLSVSLTLTLVNVLLAVGIIFAHSPLAIAPHLLVAASRLGSSKRNLTRALAVSYSTYTTGFLRMYEFESEYSYLVSLTFTCDGFSSRINKSRSLSHSGLTNWVNAQCIDWLIALPRLRIASEASRTAAGGSARRSEAPLVCFTVRHRICFRVRFRIVSKRAIRSSY